MRRWVAVGVIMSSFVSSHAAQRIVIWKAEVLDRVEREQGVVNLRWEHGLADVPRADDVPHVLYVAIEPGSGDPELLAGRICRLIADIKDPGAGDVYLQFFEPAEFRLAERPIAEVKCP